MKLALPIVEILAKEKGWSLFDHQVKNKMISFFRRGVRLNIYYTTGTVGTCMDHPTKGKTQLFRRGVDTGLLEKIFDNPRVHTGEGYYRRG